MSVQAVGSLSLSPVAAGSTMFARRRLSLVRAGGKCIRGLVTHTARRARATVILTPGFGKTVRHGAFLAASFAANGCDCWRFDVTDHAGASDGEMTDACLGAAVLDLQALCPAARAHAPSVPLVLVSISIAARAAIRAAAEGLDADMTIAVFPVVDVQKTLCAALGEDFMPSVRSGAFGPENPLTIAGHAVSGLLMHDAVERGMSDLDSTIADFARIRMPLFAVAARDDEWVNVEDVEAAVARHRGEKDVTVLADSSHDSYSFEFVRTLYAAIDAYVERRAPREGPRVDLGFSQLLRAVRDDKEALRDSSADRYV